MAVGATLVEGADVVEVRGDEVEVVGCGAAVVTWEMALGLLDAGVSTRSMATLTPIAAKTTTTTAADRTVGETPEATRLTLEANAEMTRKGWRGDHWVLSVLARPCPDPPCRVTSSASTSWAQWDATFRWGSRSVHHLVLCGVLLTGSRVRLPARRCPGLPKAVRYDR
jgi:hypothetical protein